MLHHHSVEQGALISFVVFFRFFLWKGGRKFLIFSITDLTFPIAHNVSVPWSSITKNAIAVSVWPLFSWISKVVNARNRNFRWTKDFHRGVFSKNKWKPVFFQNAGNTLFHVSDQKSQVFHPNTAEALDFKVLHSGFSWIFPKGFDRKNSGKKDLPNKLVEDAKFLPFYVPRKDGDHMKWETE